MVRLEMKTYNTILTEKQQKFQYFYQVNLINMNILQAKSTTNKITYSPLGKDLEKQTKTIQDGGKKMKL